MTAAVMRRAFSGNHTRFGGHEPPPVTEVIKNEAKRALWIYPLCFATGALVTVVISLVEAVH